MRLHSYSTDYHGIDSIKCWHKRFVRMVVDFYDFDIKTRKCFCFGGGSCESCYFEAGVDECFGDGGAGVACCACYGDRVD